MPLDSPPGAQDEGHEGAAAPGQKDASGVGEERGVVAFNQKTLKALLRVYSDDAEEVAGDVVKSVAKVLSLSEKDVTRAITAKVRALREEVEYLLGVVEEASGDEGDRMRQGLADDAAPVSLQQLAEWRKSLDQQLFHVQMKDAEAMLQEHFHERNASPQYQEQERILENMEVVFLLKDIAKNRETKVREVLEAPIETAGPGEALSEIRERLFDLLSKRRQKEFDVAQKLDLLREEMWQEREEDEYERLSGKILALFGRGKGEAPFHTQKSLAKALRVEEGRIKHILGQMNQERKIGFMMGTGGQEVYMCRDKKIFEYLPDELIAELDPAYFDQVGTFLKKTLDQGEVVDREYLEENEHECKLPSDVAACLLDCYVAKTNLVKKTKEKGYHLTEEGRGVMPSSGLFERAHLAQKLYLPTGGPYVEEGRSSRDVYRERRHVKEITVDLPEKESGKILWITEVQFGHRDCDEEALALYKERIEKLPPEECPDTIILSGIVFGRYRHFKKNNVLVKDEEIEEQLQKTGKLLQWCIGLREKWGKNVKIIYNKSDNDKDLARDYTYDAVSKVLRPLLRSQSRGGKGSAEAVPEASSYRGATYYEFDHAQHTKAWQWHECFQYDVVVEYMVRCHRPLYTALEVREKCGEDKFMEEYLLLLYAYGKLKNGESLEKLAEGGDKLAKLALEVLVVENIPVPGKVFTDFTVTSDVNLTMKTKGKEWKDEERHYFRQSPTSKVKYPLDAAADEIRNRLSQGLEVPTLRTVQGEKFWAGVHLHEQTFLVSTPGMHRYDPNIDAYGRTESDEGERISKTRRDLLIPGMTAVEYTDDGRFLMDIYDEKLLKIAEKSDEQMVAIFLSDFQVGSVTARPDLLVKNLDFIFHHILPHKKVVLYINGDVIQGYNYGKFPIENAGIGLMGPEAQNEFVARIFHNILSHVPSKYKANLELVAITPGNHEWNTGRSGEYGTSHLQQLKEIFRGYSENKWTTKLFDNQGKVQGKRGHWWIGPTAITDVQHYHLLVQHYLLEHGSSKGGGGFSLLAGRQLLAGMGDQFRDVHIFNSGHLHYWSMYGQNGKFFTQNSSLAGTSSFEQWRGHDAVRGSQMMHLGGRRAPKIEVLTPEFLHQYVPQGAYSDAELLKQGFRTDRGFDPKEDGFSRFRTNGQIQKMSAIQKKLCDEVEDINWGDPGKL